MFWLDLLDNNKPCIYATIFFSMLLDISLGNIYIYIFFFWKQKFL